MELAVAKGPLKLQAEYSHINLTATGKSGAALTPGTLYDVRSAGNAKVFYVDMMYNLTGEPWAPTYRSGVVGAIRPTSPVDLSNMTGTGAWQVGLRYSAYDASSFGSNTSTSGGDTDYTYNGNNAYEIEGSPKGNTTTLALNWILNPNARIMMNYSQSVFDYSFTPVDIGSSSYSAVRGNTSRAFMIRSQFNF
jgi:phosphate-selective porin OprO/OprP